MLFPSRKYKSGSGFAFWRWTDVELGGELYLRRLHLIQVPLIGALMIHWIKKPDPQPDLHDHPINFFSIVLKGWYDEELFAKGTHSFDNIRVLHRVDWFNFIGSRTAHRITSVDPDGVLTFVLAGPKVREWGFYTPDGWQHWKEYDK